MSYLETIEWEIDPAAAGTPNSFLDLLQTATSIATESELTLILDGYTGLWSRLGDPNSPTATRAECLATSMIWCWG
jgi:hypothetical protein